MTIQDQLSGPYQANRGNLIVEHHPNYGSSTPYRDGWWLNRDTEWSQVLGIYEIEKETQLFVRPILQQTGHKVSNPTWV